VGIGGSIFLIALGAILAFAVNASIGWLDLQVVGWVMIFAGIAGLILTLWFWQSRRRTVVTTARPVDTHTHRVEPVDNRRVVEERRTEVRPSDQPY
jgi:Domain of unknown function (DUF6458)